MYEVIVSNIGSVYKGTDLTMASDTYNEYCKLSISDRGKASGETVTVFQDGEIMNEHIGRDNFSEFYDSLTNEHNGKSIMSNEPDDVDTGAVFQTEDLYLLEVAIVAAAEYCHRNDVMFKPMVVEQTRVSFYYLFSKILDKPLDADDPFVIWTQGYVAAMRSIYDRLAKINITKMLLGVETYDAAYESEQIRHKKHMAKMAQKRLIDQ